jgi:hypothetical protein
VASALFVLADASTKEETAKQQEDVKVGKESVGDLSGAESRWGGWGGRRYGGYGYGRGLGYRGGYWGAGRGYYRNPYYGGWGYGEISAYIHAVQ